MKKMWALLLLFILVIALYALSTVKQSPIPTTNLETPLGFYQKGERAKSVEERTNAFNKALSLYLDIEKAFAPDAGNGKLSFDIANTYFQLEEYPWAIFYYYKAHHLRPRDAAVIQNLNTALNTVKLPPLQPFTPWEKVFLLKGVLTMPQLLQIFASVALITFGLASWEIWVPNLFTRTLLIFFMIFFVYLTINLAYQYYFSPIEAVVVQATPLYKGAGEEYALVKETPLPGGSKVEVLETSNEGHWLKVKTSEDTLGFIPSSSIRMLYK